MPVLERWTPFRDLELMEQRMRRLFPNLVLSPAFAPATDVYETSDEVVFELEVPGFAEKELRIEVVDHALVVKGERKAEAEKSEKDFRLQERLESTFERSFALPSEADGEHVKAVYGNGLLTLRVPKLAQPKPRTVPIEKE
jgi:HSP20 family protein